MEDDEKAQVREESQTRSRSREIAAERDAIKRELMITRDELTKETQRANRLMDELNATRQEVAKLRGRIRQTRKADIEVPSGCFVVIEPFSGSTDEGKPVNLAVGDVVADSAESFEAASELNRRVVLLHREDLVSAQRAGHIEQ